MTPLQTQACPPKQTFNMQLKPTSTLKITPKLQDDLLNHYFCQGTVVWRLSSAMCRMHSPLNQAPGTSPLRMATFYL